MIIELPKVGVDGSRYTGEEAPEIFGLEGVSGIKITGPMGYDVTAQIVTGELLVRGSLWLPVSLQCCRCADFFSTIIKVSDFLRGYQIGKDQETVDVTPEMREDVLIELPAYPRCSPDCEGLCPQCGRNLNNGRCDCEPSGWQPAWTALNGLNWPKV